MRLQILIIGFITDMIISGCHNKVESAKIPEKYSSFSEYCVGRNFIEIPSLFSRSKKTFGEFTPAVYEVKSEAFNIVVDSEKWDKAKFSSHLKNRSEKLSDPGIIPTLDVLRREQRLSDVATLFRVQHVDDAFQNELHFMLGENLVVITLDSYENTYVLAEERLIKLMSDVVITDESNARGFCVGPVTIQGDFVQERGTYYWRDNAGNTLDIQIDTYATDDPKGLLQRMAGPDSLLCLFHIGHTVLRSGERTVAGMRAQEWLGWTKLGHAGDQKGV